ncbi:MAG: ATP synthase F0 subunit C [Oscillospiraceae bacterium]|nr:ATP synthase F0 subunit C [Oscillospiraceae bacterium]
MDPLALIISVAQIAAVIALLNGVLTTLGDAKIAVAAIEAIARQPEAAGSVTSNMFIGMAFAETSGIYGLLVAIILLFANPLIPIYLANAA